jgi:hypothetical protein
LVTDKVHLLMIKQSSKFDSPLTLTTGLSLHQYRITSTLHLSE